MSMSIDALIAAEVERQIDQRLDERIAPLNALLSQIWSTMQANGATAAAPDADDGIPDPPVPDPAIPQTAIPDMPVDIPPIPGFGPAPDPGVQPGAGPDAAPADEAAIRARLEQAARVRQGEQDAAIARRTALIEARIAQRLAAHQP